MSRAGVASERSGPDDVRELQANDRRLLVGPVDDAAEAVRVGELVVVVLERHRELRAGVRMDVGPELPVTLDAHLDVRRVQAGLAAVGVVLDGRHLGCITGGRVGGLGRSDGRRRRLGGLGARGLRGRRRG